MGGPSAIPSMSAASDVAGLRAMVDQMIAAQVAAGPAPDYSGVKKSQLQIPVRDGSSIRGVLYQPESGSGGPLAVIFHGGGFCIGMPEMEEPVALELVRGYAGVVLSVDYRLAPEHPFPVPIDDSFDALKWAASQAKDWGADASKGFIVGGTSAGAIISAVVSHQARDEKLSPPLTGVWLNVPHVVDQSVLPEKWRGVHTSHEQNKDAPILDKAAVEFFMRESLSLPPLCALPGWGAS
jgi:acetyl esterase/lipase